MVSLTSICLSTGLWPAGVECGHQHGSEAGGQPAGGPDRAIVLWVLMGGSSSCLRRHACSYSANGKCIMSRLGLGSKIWVCQRELLIYLYFLPKTPTA